MFVHDVHLETVPHNLDHPPNLPDAIVVQINFVPDLEVAPISALILSTDFLAISLHFQRPLVAVELDFDHEEVTIFDDKVFE